jgi:hypothetical protein
MPTQTTSFVRLAKPRRAGGTSTRPCTSRSTTQNVALGSGIERTRLEHSLLELLPDRVRQRLDRAPVGKLGEHELLLTRRSERLAELDREAGSPLRVDRMIVGSEEHGLPYCAAEIRSVTLFPTLVIDLGPSRVEVNSGEGCNRSGLIRRSVPGLGGAMILERGSRVQIGRPAGSPYLQETDRIRCRLWAGASGTLESWRLDTRSPRACPPDSRRTPPCRRGRDPRD